MDYSDIAIGEVVEDEELEFNIDDYFPGDTLNIGESPTTESWKYRSLFLDGINNETRIWAIGFDHSKEHLKILKSLLAQEIRY